MHEESNGENAARLEPILRRLLKLEVSLQRDGVCRPFCLIEQKDCAVIEIDRHPSEGHADENRHHPRQLCVVEDRFQIDAEALFDLQGVGEHCVDNSRKYAKIDWQKEDGLSTHTSPTVVNVRVSLAVWHGNGFQFVKTEQRWSWEEAPGRKPFQNVHHDND